MTASNPQHEFALEVVRRLREAGHQALWAGGCVRDLLLGREPQDYDVATDAVPETVRDLFGRRRTLAVGASFGVIIVRGPQSEVEVATFRTDLGYSDGRRPDAVAFSTPQEDAQRRDFTINGMFYDPIAERIIDYVGGEEDLKRRIIRAIGRPEDRMAEDKLRMLRAVRFAARFDFAIDPATLTAIQQQARELVIVSAERIAAEMRHIL
ncbi:MAG: CCA tRNA nucleotidyltransferase, partial [Planctomycetaceae bacterium]